MAKIADSLKLNQPEIEQIMQTESRLRIATIGPGHEINLTPMTFGWAGQQIYIFGRGQKVANIRRTPTATVLVDLGEQWRELKGIMLRGEAKILESSQEEATDEFLAEAQLNLGLKHQLQKDGKTVPYEATASGRTRRWIVFIPKKVISWDNS
ncbi:MAG: pyridoxamine 5'-phosphate oxidase family protein, partial [Pseudomonadota bacterium]